jgi:hypothetical protein
VKKNASVFWVFLNRHVQKMLNYFEDSSPLYDFYGKDLSNKKNQRSLPSLCPEIFCRKSTHFFKKRVILLAPTVYVVALWLVNLRPIHTEPWMVPSCKLIVFIAILALWRTVCFLLVQYFTILVEFLAFKTTWSWHWFLSFSEMVSWSVGSSDFDKIFEN